MVSKFSPPWNDAMPFYRTRLFLAALVLTTIGFVGCAEDELIPPKKGTSGEAGTSQAGTAGNAGVSGTNSVGGTAGTVPSAGNGGTTSGNSGAGGSAGTAGTSSGNGGTSGSAGSGGSSGAGTAGTAGTSSNGTAGVSGTSGTGGTGGAGMGGSAGIAGTSGGAGLGGTAGVAGNAGTAGGAGSVTVPLDGFGIITGECGLIDAMEIESPSSFVFQNTIDFEMNMYDYNKLSPGGKILFDNGNLGGNSLYSEIFSYEVLYRCDLAQLLKTEAQVKYTDTGGKKTDILVMLDGHKVGVSVTRAYGFPPENPYTVQQATSLLNSKLSDILLSSANVAPEDKWTKQILHVIAYKPEHAMSIAQAYNQLDAMIKADTILLVTVTEGDDAFLY
jgi:hypothetical protein